MSKQMPNIIQIAEQINVVSDMVSRNDERIKALFKDQESLENNLKNIEERVRAIELKIENTTIRLSDHDARWFNTLDTIWKLTLMVIASYILYVLGLQSPSI